MSMISSLIDELNKSADVCREAADTIWELRDDLQRANAENVKLREELYKMDVWHSKELTAAMDEIDKLLPCFPDTDKLAAKGNE